MGTFRKIRRNLEHKTNRTSENKKMKSSLIQKDNAGFYDPIKELKEKQRINYHTGRNYHPKYDRKTLG